MNSKITLYQLPPSPNNIKIRIALGYKKIDYESVTIDFRDRSKVIEVSGQPLTPVLKDGDCIIYDSGAILRYLDANFLESPRLFSKDYQVMKTIEKWELFSRTDLTDHVRIMVGQLINQTEEEEYLNRANRLLQENTLCIESQLKDTPWLAGDTMTAGDIIIAPSIYYGMLENPEDQKDPLLRFFSKHLSLGENREKTREWVSKVMAFDSCSC